MRGDAFIHFVSGSRRVNIRLGVLLLISKSPQLSDISLTLSSGDSGFYLYLLCHNCMRWNTHSSFSFLWKF